MPLNVDELLINADWPKQTRDVDLADDEVRPVDALLAAGWDPAKHPRDPGGEGGGQFVRSWAGTAWSELREQFEQDKRDWDAQKKEWDAEGLETDFHDYYEFIADESGLGELPEDWTKGWTYEQETIDATNQAILEGGGLRNDLAVYRGEPSRDPQPGVRDRPTSTAMSKYNAMSYADRAGTGNESGLMAVLIPAGTKAGFDGAETEVVLPSGTDYQLQPDGTFRAVVPPEYMAEWALRASGWDESAHPRDPGGEGGGQFVEKGTTATDEGEAEEPPLTDPSLAKMTWDELYGRELTIHSEELRETKVPTWAGPKFHSNEPYVDGQFTPEEHMAIAHYQGSGYGSVNHLLRDAEDFATKAEEAEAQPGSLSADLLGNYGTKKQAIIDNVWKHVNDLDNVMRPSPSPMQVYRFNYMHTSDPVTIEAVKDVFGTVDKSIVGKTITDKGFQSTTMKEDWAIDRAHESWGILHRIRVPAGVPSAYLPSAHPSVSFDSEQELLIAREVPMKAVKYEELPNGTKVIDWEVVWEQ